STQIALISCTWSDQGMTGGDVLLLDACGGQARNITDGQLRSYTELEWERSGEGLIATAVEEAQSATCRLDLEVTCQVLWKERAVVSFYGESIFTRDRAGRRLAVVRSDPDHPAEVWSFDLDAGSWRCHTDTNPDLAGKTLHPLETHSWQSFDGSSIH